MKDGRLRAFLWVLAVVGAGLLGCDAGGTGTECGEGTVLEDGACVPATDPTECGAGTVLQDGECVPATAPTECGEGTVLHDGKCLPATAPIECAEGTVLQDGKCVIDEEAAARLLKPQVVEVKVTRLTVQDEGVRPVYPMHPLSASVTLEVDTIDAFETSVLFGLESKDGARRCIVGYWPVQMDSPAEEDAATATAQTVTLTGNFYVQPGCDALADEEDVVAWVAFDPFDHTNLSGRVLTTTEDQPLIDFVLQSRLSLDGCTAPETAHPDTCVTALEVAASPGRDVEMTKATVGSTVAVLEVLDAVPNLGDTQITDEEGNVIDLGPVMPAKPHATVPHFVVNAALRVFGLDGTDEDKIDDAALSLNYAIRPLLDPGQDTDLPAETLDWQPLFAEIQEEPKAGEEPIIQQLEEQFLKSMVGAQDLVQTSPIFITGNAEGFMTRGLWADFDQFELRVCAVADFEERGVADDAGANNCSIIPVTVVRRHSRGDPLADNPGASELAYGIHPSKTFGDTEKIAVRFSLVGETISGDAGAAAGGKLGAYLMGWWQMTLFEAKRYGWDYYANSKPDEIITTVTVFGFKIANSSEAFPTGEKEYTPWSYTQSSPKAVAVFSVLGLFNVGVKAWVDGTVGVRGSLGREVITAASTNPKCTAATAVVNGSFCVKAFNESRTRQQAAEACRADYGWLAQPNSLAFRTAIRDAARKANITNYWYWVDGEAPGGVSCKAEYEKRLRECELAVPWVEKPYEKCKQTLDTWMNQECKPLWANEALWAWKSPVAGNVQSADATWAPYQPSDSGAGERFLAQNDNRMVGDFGDNAAMPYVCQYPASFTAGGKVWVSVGPFATLTLVAQATVDVAGFGGGVWGAVDLVDASLPATLSTLWMAGSPLLTLSEGKLEFVLRGLSGAVGGVVLPFEWQFTLYEWDGIDYARWTVDTMVPRWFGH